MYIYIYINRGKRWQTAGASCRSPPCQQTGRTENWDIKKRPVPRERANLSFNTSHATNIFQRRRRDNTLCILLHCVWNIVQVCTGWAKSYFFFFFFFWQSVRTKETNFINFQLNLSSNDDFSSIMFWKLFFSHDFQNCSLRTPEAFTSLCSFFRYIRNSEDVFTGEKRLDLDLRSWFTEEITSESSIRAI